MGLNALSELPDSQILNTKNSTTILPFAGSHLPRKLRLAPRRMFRRPLNLKLGDRFDVGPLERRLPAPWFRSTRRSSCSAIDGENSSNLTPLGGTQTRAASTFFFANHQPNAREPEQQHRPSGRLRNRWRWEGRCWAVLPAKCCGKFCQTRHARYVEQQVPL
jgi:hypothetical protein